LRPFSKGYDSVKGETLVSDPKPAIDLLGRWSSCANIVCAIVSVISLGVAIYQFCKRKSQDDTLNGFLHGIKPTIEDASLGQNTSPILWKAVLEQINDMLGRLDPPK
jgi:hypothetical protein